MKKRMVVNRMRKVQDSRRLVVRKCLCFGSKYSVFVEYTLLHKKIKLGWVMKKDRSWLSELTGCHPF